MRWTALALALAAALCAVAVVVALRSEDAADAGAGNPESALTPEEASAPLDGPPELVALREQANEVIPADPESFRAVLEGLRGQPIVVNKWASWCGPCRLEFPHFQAQAIERGEEVAFLGLVSNDGEATARNFLEQLPLPYPSYLDPDLEIANGFDAGREFPATLFFDERGELVHTKLGPYVDEADLAADIERYAG
jgi:cytochrome c biogenesis protein CcmG, thiol:disulfide interchange protein DsbE